jgi:hypothetical protein
VAPEPTRCLSACSASSPTRTSTSCPAARRAVQLVHRLGRRRQQAVPDLHGKRTAAAHQRAVPHQRQERCRRLVEQRRHRRRLRPSAPRPYRAVYSYSGFPSVSDPDEMQDVALSLCSVGKTGATGADGNPLRKIASRGRLSPVALSRAAPTAARKQPSSVHPATSRRPFLASRRSAMPATQTSAPAAVARVPEVPTSASHHGSRRTAWGQDLAGLPGRRGSPDRELEST